MIKLEDVLRRRPSMANTSKQQLEEFWQCQGWSEEIPEQVFIWAATAELDQTDVWWNAWFLVSPLVIKRAITKLLERVEKRSNPRGAVSKVVRLARRQQSGGLVADVEWKSVVAELDLVADHAKDPAERAIGTGARMFINVLSTADGEFEDHGRWAYTYLAAGLARMMVPLTTEQKQQEEIHQLADLVASYK